jgi:hypothetical protein
MGTWPEVCAIAKQSGARQLNDTALLFEVQGAEHGSVQKVFVFHEVMQPDFEFLQIQSAFASIQDVDVEKVIKDLGKLQVGAIGYSPFYDDDGDEIDGVISITTSIPLSPFDLSDPTPFLIYLHILAKAANTIERNLAVTVAPGPMALSLS